MNLRDTVLAHFYNPLTGQPLTSLGIPSPDWALEDLGPRSLLFLFEQKFSFADARLQFFCALTIDADIPQECQDAGLTDAKQAWGLTFQTLGQIIHHLQDMAQPQHARNDAHLKVSQNGNLFFENKSLYEILTSFKDITQIPATYAPVYGTSDTATFNTPRKFWDTDDGKGIAEYTNRGFVSAGTNFDQYNPVKHPLPQIGTEWAEDKTVLCQEISQQSGVPLPTGPAGQALPCLMTFIRTPVNDFYRPAQNAMNEKTSTHSIFSADLKRFTQTQVYTLNSFNFDEARNFLIPRAVGYSAGLINYFFRGVGKLTVSTSPSDSNLRVVKNESEELLQGSFELCADQQDGMRFCGLPGWTWSTPEGGLAPGQTMEVSSFSPLTEPQHPDQYLLVFRGTMGEEQQTAIAASMVHIAPPPDGGGGGGGGCFPGYC